MLVAHTAAHRILEVARALGIHTVFGVHGANIEDLYAAGQTMGMPMVVAKHEFAAGAMADGVARMTGAPGMVVTTSGGGALNVVAALAESYDSRVPVLAVVGAPPTTLTARGAFQDMLDPPDTIDLVAVLGGVTGHCAVLHSVADLEPALEESFAAQRRGLPAALIVPKDVQRQPYHGTIGAVIGKTLDHVEETSASLDTLAALLAERATAGARVCVWVGDEVSRADAGDTVSEIATMLGASIVAAPGGADAVTHLAPHAGVTGVMGHPSAQRALADADVCLALGTRITVTDRAGLDDLLETTELYHVGVHSPRFPSKTVAVTSIDTALEHLSRQLATHPPTSPPAHHTSQISIDRLVTPPVAHSSLPTLPALMAAIEAELPHDARVFADAGNVGAAAVHHLTPRRSGRFTVALGMGGMGYAIAAGIGVAIDDPSHRSVVIAGDGAFFMHGMEFHTAVQHDAPVTLIVLNNNAHGMCVTRERLYFPETFVVNRFCSSDIAGAVAAMFAGVTVRHPRDAAATRTACADLFTESGPNCLVVECHSDEIAPFAPFLPREDSA
ncbi:thiamine pyrophosphate enzyme-like protein [Gordonia polyisoprenivorans VH2]|uniref:acetolactate synthase n=1 Tax=Gordonia polyisoprenivorans (strain DSM 44266 / VH2) TaxID=1112204 RepID=H6MWP8_GORPV|nr:thiamine pyrophosphate-binding protein [Gordonia polyisoprenivorans]AFA75459.1 thiamine pyrophosphate enzyme-like protein [Gordonia polyisoprenivorans VH2]